MDWFCFKWRVRADLSNSFVICLLWVQITYSNGHLSELLHAQLLICNSTNQCIYKMALAFWCTVPPLPSPWKFSPMLVFSGYQTKVYALLHGRRVIHCITVPDRYFYILLASPFERGMTFFVVVTNTVFQPWIVIII